MLIACMMRFCTAVLGQGTRNSLCYALRTMQGAGGLTLEIVETLRLTCKLVEDSGKGGGEGKAVLRNQSRKSLILTWDQEVFG